MRLERYSYAPDCTLGVLTLVDFECFTLELPWLGNRVGRSCVPEGRYALHRRPYWGGGYEVLGLREVPARSDILIHIANRPSELRGCIAPGLRVGVLGRERAVLQSKLAFTEIMRRVGPGVSSIEITYRDRYGPSRV